VLLLEAGEEAQRVEVIEGDDSLPGKGVEKLNGQHADGEEDEEGSDSRKGIEDSAGQDKTIIVEHHAPQEQATEDRSEEQKRVADRMRAALQALRERRADLEAANGELAAEKEKSESLAEQLQAEKDTNALLDARSSALQAQLNEAQAELARAQGSGSGGAGGISEELALARKKNVELRMQISEEGGVARAERDKARKELAEWRRQQSAASAGQSQEVEALRADVHAARQERDGALLAQNALEEEVGRLRARLRSLGVEADVAARPKRKALPMPVGVRAEDVFSAPAAAEDIQLQKADKKEKKRKREEARRAAQEEAAAVQVPPPPPLSLAPIELAGPRCEQPWLYH